MHIHIRNNDKNNEVFMCEKILVARGDWGDCVNRNNINFEAATLQNFQSYVVCFAEIAFVWPELYILHILCYYLLQLLHKVRPHDPNSQFTVIVNFFKEKTCKRKCVHRKFSKFQKCVKGKMGKF